MSHNRIEYKRGDKIGECIYLHDTSPYVYKNKKINRRAKFKCCQPGCNNEFECIINGVKSGNTVSCGCYRLKRVTEAKYKHGQSGTRLYYVWAAMINRCYNPDHAKYERYGGRGITVCDEWRNDPRKYIEYVKSLPGATKKGYSIDRENNDGNYEPGNIRWVPAFIQSQNTGINKRNTSGYKGVSWSKQKNKWRARVQIKGNEKHVGFFCDKIKAAKAINMYLTKQLAI